MKSKIEALDDRGPDPDRRGITAMVSENSNVIEATNTTLQRRAPDAGG